MPPLSLTFQLPARPCYNARVITYSRNDMERGLASDQALWRKVPASATALLWPLLAIFLGWNPGWWVGLLAMLTLAAASVVLPSRTRLNIYLVDGMERLLRLPVRLAWLLMVWHLGFREPLFPILGQPILGAIAVTLALFLGTMLLTILVRLVTGLLAPPHKP